MVPDAPAPQEPIVEPVEPQATEPAAAPAAPQYATVDQFKSLETALTTIARHLSAQAAAPAQPAPQRPDELSDDELWAQAQSGNQHAFRLWQQRIARAEAERVVGNQRQDQTVMGQLTALYTKYPELGDPQHPLTQRAIAFKAALVQMGESATARKTDLDAILRAVADSRDLIAPRTTPAARSAAPTGQMGAMHRAPDAPAANDGTKVTPAQAKLARQMGVKEPGKAIKKFWERNENGTSRVSPNIAAAIERAG